MKISMALSDFRTAVPLGKDLCIRVFPREKSMGEDERVACHLSKHSVPIKNGWF